MENMLCEDTCSSDKFWYSLNEDNIINPDIKFCINECPVDYSFQDKSLKECFSECPDYWYTDTQDNKKYCSETCRFRETTKECVQSCDS